jgi:hypothetical protein
LTSVCAWWNVSTLFGSVGGTKQSIGDAQFAYDQSEGPGEDEALSAVHLLVYAPAISPIHKVGEIMHSFL